jgi:signal transduction histidine kinase
MLFFQGKYRTILISAAFFICFDLVVVLSSFIVSSQLKEDAVVINLAGRQRMLSQKIAKSILQLQIAEPTKILTSDHQAELREAYQLFDQTLIGLEIGGIVTGSDTKTLIIHRMKNIKSHNLVIEAQKIWRIYKTKINPIISAENKIPQPILAEAIIFDNENNYKLLKLMNELTTEQQNISKQRTYILQLIQGSGLLMALINFFILVSYSLQKLVDSDIKNEELKRTQMQLLIQTEKMSSLSLVIAGIAHEINNPISFIYSNIPHTKKYIDDFLELITLYEKYSVLNIPEILYARESMDLDFIRLDLLKILKSMEIGANRIREIVLSLRTFARLGESELKQVDILEAIDSILVILNGRLKTDNSQIIQVIKKYQELPLVECYAAKINQVFLNILTNAVDALAEIPVEQEPQILITTKLLESDTVLICIANNGIHIPPDIQKQIFDPFFTTKPVGTGTGLGLSISYQIIVEEHQGKISCVSAPGENTEFYIQIPLFVK